MLVLNSSRKGAMEEIKQALAQHGFEGELDDATDTLEKYSHDASMFEIKPRLVIAPKPPKMSRRPSKLLQSARRMMRICR